MPKFTIKDVDNQIEEIRNRHQQSKSQVGDKPQVLQMLLDKAKLKVKPKPIEGEQEV